MSSDAFLAHQVVKLEVTVEFLSRLIHFVKKTNQALGKAPLERRNSATRGARKSSDDIFSYSRSFAIDSKISGPKRSLTSPFGFNCAEPELSREKLFCANKPNPVYIAAIRSLWPD